MTPILNIVPFVSVDTMMKLVLAIGIERFLVELADRGDRPASPPQGKDGLGLHDVDLLPHARQNRIQYGRMAGRR